MREKRREERVGGGTARVHPPGVGGEEVLGRRQVQQQPGGVPGVALVVGALEQEEPVTRADGAPDGDLRSSRLEAEHREPAVGGPAPARLPEGVGPRRVGSQRGVRLPLPACALHPDELVYGRRVGAAIAHDNGPDAPPEAATPALQLVDAPRPERRRPPFVARFFPHQDRALPSPVGRHGEGEVEAGLVPRGGHPPVEVPAVHGDQSRPLTVRANLAGLECGQQGGDGGAGAHRVGQRGAQHHEQRDGPVFGPACERGQRAVAPAPDRAGEHAQHQVVSVGDLEERKAAPVWEVGRGGAQTLGLERRVRFERASGQRVPAALIGFVHVPQRDRSHVHLALRSVLVAFVLLGVGVLPWLGAAPFGVRAGAASPEVMFSPVVVQSRTIAVNGTVPKAGLDGPAAVRVRFRHPTRRGTLLVAAIIDGVEQGPQPSWRIPRWRRGAGTIGGQLATSGRPTSGGLQSEIFFDPDNPGGITSVAIGKVPAGTITWVTVVLTELSGVPQQLHVVARGGSTSGPSASDYTTFSWISTAAPPTQLPALVLTSFTNGGLAAYGERFSHSPGWRMLGADRERNGIDQPVLLDERVWRSASRPTQWMRYRGGDPIDNCAAIVALY
jgi:hypothetical protein